MKYFVQPDEAWVDNVLKKQGDEVEMSEDQARYLVSAGVLGTTKAKSSVKAAPKPAPVPQPAVKDSGK